MIAVDRREAMLLALGGAAAFCITSDASAQVEKPSISGRALDKDGKAVKKLGCSVSGPDNISRAGDYKPGTGEFTFPKIPAGDSLLIELTYNGEVFRYPIINRGGTSRIEVRLPQLLKERTQKENLVTTILQAVSAIAGFALALKISPDVRESYFKNGGFQETRTVLLEAEKLIGDRTLIADGVEKTLVVNLTRDTIALWSTIG